MTGETGITANNNTDKRVWRSDSRLDFGCFKGRLISDLQRTANGRNYLIWMRKNGFKFSLQIMLFCDERRRLNLIDSIGQSVYEKEDTI